MVNSKMHEPRTFVDKMTIMETNSRRNNFFFEGNPTPYPVIGVYLQDLCLDIQQLS